MRDWPRRRVPSGKRSVRRERCPQPRHRARTLAWAAAAALAAGAPWPAGGGAVGTAQARTVIEMTPVVGFAGYYARNHWVPVDLVIQNRGPAVSATFTLDVDQAIDTGRTAQGVLAWSARLPAHGWAHVHIAVPGNLIDGMAGVDCWVGGQPVATAFLSGNAVSNVALVAVLTHNAQDAQFLTGATEGPQGNPVLPVAVDPLNFPTTPNALTALSAVAVTPSVLAALSPAQAAALKAWIKFGGMLIWMGAGPPPSGWAAWAPLRPGPVRAVSGQALAANVGNTSAKIGKVWVAAAGVEPAAALWAGTPDAPLVAAQPIGRGWVVQTAFSPLSPQLLGWSGNAEMWTALLGAGMPHGWSAWVAPLDPAGVLGLTAASDALSPLRVPSLRAWAWVFVAYTLLAGPVLFLWLRRKKREPWAWFILPALSVVTTLGIYGFGVAERPPGILTDGLGVLELAGDGTAFAYGIRGFMAPFTVNARMDAPAGSLVLPLAAQTVRQLGSAVVREGRQVTASFSGVGRWGIRYAYVSAPAGGQGAVFALLTARRDTGLYGYVRNDTPYPLHDAALWWNGRLYELGDLDPGTARPVGDATAQTTAEPTAFAAYAAYNRDLARGFGRPLANFAAQYLFAASLPPGQAMFVATTDSRTPALPSLLTRQRVASDQHLVLVRQFVPVSAGWG